MTAVTPFLGLSGSTSISVPTYSGTPGPGPVPNPWKVNGATIYYDEGGAILPQGVTGGSQGKGSINATGVFQNGVPVSGSGGPPSGPAGGALAGFYPSPDIAADLPLPGNPTTTTQAPGTDDDTLATTKFVTDAINDLPPMIVDPNGVAFGDATTGSITSDAAAFNWDDLNKRLGLSVAVPGAKIDVFNDKTAAAGDVPSAHFTEVWAANIVYSAIRVDVTNTLSDPQSTLLRLRVGGLDKFAVGPNGNCALAGGVFALGSQFAQQGTNMIPGGLQDVGYLMSSVAHFGTIFGIGLPDKVMAKGSLYMRGDGAGTPYYNSDGTATGWLPIGSGGAVISTTAPTSPTNGMLWFWSDGTPGGGSLFIYYDDGSSQQWVPATPAPPAVGIPPGSIMDYAGATSPTGWLIANGQAVSRTAFAGLFAAIGTVYGIGDGSTTFNVPDLRGRVTAGVDAGAGRLTTAISGVAGTLGSAGGDQSMQSHFHVTAVPVMVTVGPGNGSLGAGGNFNVQSINTTSAGAGASQNVQPTLIMNKIIKV